VIQFLDRIDRMFRIKIKKNLVNPVGKVLPQAAKFMRIDLAFYTIFISRIWFHTSAALPRASSLIDKA